MGQVDPSEANVAILVDGLVAYLSERHKNKPAATATPTPTSPIPAGLSRVFASFSDHLVALMLVARSDDIVANTERAVILRYCVERARKMGFVMTPEEETALADYLHGFRPSIAQIVSAIDQTKRESKGAIGDLIAGARRVVEADGVVRLQEALYLGSLQRDLLAALVDVPPAPTSGEAFMELDVKLIDNVAHVKLRGRLDTHGVDQVETKFTASVVPGHHNTVVDLSELTFVTSMGLRMFISVARALKRHNAKMVLFAPQAQAKDVFESASLSQIIPIVDTEAEALAKIAG